MSEGYLCVAVFSGGMFCGGYESMRIVTELDHYGIVCLYIALQWSYN